MSKKTQLVAKIAAILAGLGLIAMTFAPAVGAQSNKSDFEVRIQALRAQVAALQAELQTENRNPATNMCAAWSRDLRVGSSGEEVTSLQELLISKGFEIKAGATGYFGGQTQTALARYQASIGVRPAAGYFGPLTRANLNTICVDTPEVDNNNDNDNDEDEDEDEDEEEEDSEVEARVRTTATMDDNEGADNDTATFLMEIDLEAFGEDAYIDINHGTSIDYEIEDGNGDAIGSFTSLNALLQSSADRDGDYFILEEGEVEELTLTITIDPLAVDEGAYFRLKLTGVNFSKSAQVPDDSWTPRPEKRYATDYVYIAD